MPCVTMLSIAPLATLAPNEPTPPKQRVSPGRDAVVCGDLRPWRRASRIGVIVAGEGVARGDIEGGQIPIRLSGHFGDARDRVPLHRHHV